jgi:hypothetical protein
LVEASDFPVEQTQRGAWLQQVTLLKDILTSSTGQGAVYFEFAIPRLGRRIDVVLVLDHVIFVLEFKVGERSFNSGDLDQVWDYALDLKNFHEPSHHLPLAPILIATQAGDVFTMVATTLHSDQLLRPLRANTKTLPEALKRVAEHFCGAPIDWAYWQSGRYLPTPTIVEAATALYAGHAVEAISRNDAGAQNLALTANRVSEVVEAARRHGRKVICFVTGVPGAGKTLVGLDVANRHTNKDDDLYSVFLSGNGPLVRVLVEALARDRVRRAAEQGEKERIGEARSAVKQFIQAIHHFRDEGLIDPKPPVEHVALFESPRDPWRLQLLREWSHEQVQAVFPRGA